MFTVKLLNNIKSPELSKFDGAKYQVSADAAAPDAIMVRSAKLHDEVFNSELLCIARAGAGYNTIPTARCADEGIVVFNTPGANAQGVMELAICALFLAGRNIIDGVQWVKSVADQKDEVAALVEKQKAQYSGPEILGKTLGVIGLGAIGAKIANAAAALGMKVLGYDPYLSDKTAKMLNSEITLADSLEVIYEKSDFISLNLPYMDSTKHFINKDTIAKMKQGVRIINMARAELVCDTEIIEALESGHVACYVTDFPNGATAGAKGVVPIPHLGASTPESEDNCVCMAADEIMAYLEDGNIINSVNIPNAYLERKGGVRLCVIYKNDLEAKIKDLVTAQGASLLDSLNSTSDSFSHSYLIMDMDKSPDGLKDAVSALDGVSRVRVLP